MQTVPSRSVAIGRGIGQVTARANTEFEVESRNAADRPSKQGGDQVLAKFSGAASTTVTTITELPDGRYKVEYTAPGPGTYTLAVRMNGEHIAGSPFKVSVTVPRAQADKTIARGDGLFSVIAGAMGTFTVQFIDRFGGNAPPSELDVRVKPAGTPIPGPDDEIEVPPKVRATFENFDKDGSGDIDFSELRLALEMLGMGGDRKAAAVLLRRYDSDGGGLQIEEFAQLVSDMEIASSTGYLLHGVSATADKSTREVKFEVRVAGDYDVHIAFAAASGGGVLQGSPFQLKVLPNKASADSTTLPTELARGLKTAVGESGTFILQAYDQYKNACIKGGDRVKVSAVGALSATVSDLGDGSYEVSYTCDESGIHKMSITIGDTHIRGSPLSVTCEPGPLHLPSCELVHSGEGLSTIAGARNTLCIRARDRFGNITANVKQQDGGFLDFLVQLRRRENDGLPMGDLSFCEGAWSKDGVYEPSGEIEAVSSFTTIPIDIAPIAPEPKAAVVANSGQYHGAKVPAGTPLVLAIEMRDRFSNPCSWAADHYGGSLPLEIKMLRLGVVAGKGFSKAEALPSVLRVSPRDEDMGVYESRHVLCRTGRYSCVVTLDGKAIVGSPVNFRVLPAGASGLKSRLEAPAPTSAKQQENQQPAGDNASSEDGCQIPFTGQAYPLELQSRDMYGNKVEKGGASIDVQVIEPPVLPGSEADHMLAAKLDVEVIDRADGTYVINVKAAQPGEHMVTVRLDGVEVIGSPMPLSVQKPRILASTKVAGKSRGETLYIVASVIANAGVHWAFKSWCHSAYDRADALVTLNAVAGALLHGALKPSFMVWQEHAIIIADLRLQLEAAVGAVRKQLERKSFNTWISFVESRAEKVAVLQRVIAMVKNKQMLRAFNTWFLSLDSWHEVDENHTELVEAAQSSMHSTSFLERRKGNLPTISFTAPADTDDASEQSTQRSENTGE